ncbi:MAG: acyl-CoA dehydrogenase family protein [Leucobacter sp.]|nr:acyl-CoA dehydrogenase family protein [Leucobacter sp.]
MSDVDEAQLQQLRSEVRTFLAQQIETGAFQPIVDGWLSGFDAEFSRTLAAQGWVGMTIPVEYGGHGRSFMERFIVTEELLAAGAPVAAHWISDRQIAPGLLKYGTEEQKQRYLPRIAAGELYFAIGMSEPDSGSDLASVQTRAEKVDGGWRLYGTKVWTSNAHKAHGFFALVRTSPATEGDRHTGLSQLIVDLRGDGVTVNPILSLDGSAHFNEVVFDGAFVPDSDLLGTLGEGWKQVTSELKFERSGPERIMSSFPALARLTEALAADGVDPEPELGRYIARLTGLRRLSADVAKRLQKDEPVELTAAMVKILGTGLEGDLADYTATWAHELGDDTELARLSRSALMRRAGFTLRGGTNEILRGIVARGLEKQYAA